LTKARACSELEIRKGRAIPKESERVELIERFRAKRKHKMKDEEILN